jgi:hypothetical protein
MKNRANSEHLANQRALIEEAERLLEIKASLPHLYGFPWYKWAKDFFDYEGQAAFLCAANQISKSSTQIRLAIDWATDKSKWKRLWPDLLPGQIPNTFWYFYPNYETWQSEFESKWEVDFLPRGKMKDDPEFGWEVEYKTGHVNKIIFRSGVIIYAQAYSKKVSSVQAGSVHALFLDEECPLEFIPELQSRLRATGPGKIRSVFTATLGLEYWRRVIEPANKEEELYPDAFKKQVSLYDCQTYLDGSKSRWTPARIRQAVKECSTQAEHDRRILGKFCKSSGLKFESFDLSRNMMPPQIIPKSWGRFAACDPGSGGQSGHPAGIIFIAVSPSYTEGWIFRGWRGDGIPTANPDILRKFRELKGNMLTMAQVYDYKDKDFFLVAQSQGEAFSMANKSRDEGFGLLNSLFKNGMLKIFSGDVELDKLVGELMSLPAVTDSRKKDLDDLADATRYACMAIPWDFSHITEAVDLTKFNDEPLDSRTEAQRFNDDLNAERRKYMLNDSRVTDDINDINYLNELMGND